MKNQGVSAEDGNNWLQRQVLLLSAGYGAWEWSRSFQALPTKMDIVRASTLKKELGATLTPWPTEGGHQGFLMKEEWDKGVSGILGRAFARAAPKYAQAEMLYHHIDLLADGIVKSSDEGLHQTNRGLSVVFGGLLPPLMVPEVRDKNRRAWGKYYDHLTQFASAGIPNPDHKRVYVHGLPEALKKSIGHCDKYELWPNNAVRDGVVGLHQQSLIGTNQPLPKA